MSLIAGLNPQGNLTDVAVDEVGHVFTTGGVFKTSLIRIPGIGTGSAYAAADAFGTAFALQGLPTRGTISTVVFLDHDDEGINKDLVLFQAEFTGTADNSAFAVSDDDLRNVVGVIRIANWFNFGSNQVGMSTPALYYSTRPESASTMYGQFVTRGTDNIAAANIPEFFFTVVD